MSRALALELAASDDFEDFLRVAMARNDFGSPCETAQECSRHSAGMHMWHHEDAGISYNMWRVANARSLKVTVVHMPEKGWIWPWFHEKIAKPEMSGAQAADPTPSFS